MNRQFQWHLNATLIAALTLSACGHVPPPEPVVVTREVHIPVPTPCTVATPQAPDYADTRAALQAAPDIDRATRLLVAGRIQRDAYIAAILDALASCRAPSAQ